MGRLLIFCAKEKLVEYPDGVRHYFNDLREVLHHLETTYTTNSATEQG